MPKKDKRHGREGGSVTAAVTKNVPKFSDENIPKQSPQESPDSFAPPALPSPAFQPVLDVASGHPGPSPLLDAVSTTSYGTSTSPSLQDWRRGPQAGMEGSPGNLISLAGSPPTQPSSYEDGRAPLSGWSSPRRFHGLPLGASPPVGSPPLRAGTRPSSIQRETRTATPDLQTHAGLVAAARRNSTHSSQFNRPRLSPNPPLPHQPQAHFYGAPDLDSFDPQPRLGMKAGERGYYFGFDTLRAPGSHDHGPGKDNVVIAGYEGGLEVYSIGQRGREHVASLQGLRGGVVQAKILPFVVPGVDSLPLVAVVVHGPAFPVPDETGEGDYDAVSEDRSDAISNINQDVTLKDGGTSRQSPGYIDAYQTTVEIYSLKTNQRVAVLLEAPKVPLRTPITSPLFRAPPPSGAFNIKADLDSIVVSSGESGECWVYRQMTIPSHIPGEGVGLRFVCVGKVWTSLQHALKDETAEAQRSGEIPTQTLQRPQSAILSLKSGWIAYCPAAPQSHLALRAFVGTPVYGKAPLLSSLTPPHLPPVNAEVDSPVPESVVNKIMRDATQGILEGSRLVAKHGLRAWQGWWDPQAAQAARSPPSTQGWLAGHAARQEIIQFPPTHGTSAAPALPKEPGLVSVLSVESFGTSNSLHPTATFQVPHGCSFLALSPSKSKNQFGDNFPINTMLCRNCLRATRAAASRPAIPLLRAGISSVTRSATYTTSTQASVRHTLQTRLPALPTFRTYSTSSSESAAPPPEKPDYLNEAESTIWDRLVAEFEPTELVVQDISGGCGSMYGIEICSPKFAGKRMLAQQRMVNTCLGDLMTNWHGAQLKTRAP